MNNPKLQPTPQLNPQHEPQHEPQTLIWLAWVASIVGTLLLSTFGRPMQHWVYANLGKGFAAWVIGGLLVICVALVLRWMWGVKVKAQDSTHGSSSPQNPETSNAVQTGSRTGIEVTAQVSSRTSTRISTQTNTKNTSASRTNGNSIYWISLLLLAAVALIVLVLDRPEERLHFVTFGLYGFFTGALFAARSLVVTLALVCLFSGLDELYQLWLPDRVGDWRDVAMNTVAGSIGLVLQLIGTGRFSRNHRRVQRT